MTYSECLAYFHEMPVKKLAGLPDDSYYQFEIIGKERGSFYIHLADDTLEIFSGEYKQRDVQFIITLSCLEKVINSIIDPIYAYATGKLNIGGDVAMGRNFLSRISR